MFYYWIHNGRIGIASYDGTDFTPVDSANKITINIEYVPQVLSVTSQDFNIDDAELPVSDSFHETVLDGVLYRLYKRSVTPQIDPRYLYNVYNEGKKNYKRFLNRDKQHTSSIKPYEY